MARRRKNTTHYNEKEDLAPRLVKNANKANKFQYDYDEDDYLNEIRGADGEIKTPQPKMESFIIINNSTKRAVTRNLSDEELEMRRLKSEYKKRYGFKPTNMTIEELQEAMS